jgi:hypothetical protein
VSIPPLDPLRSPARRCPAPLRRAGGPRAWTHPDHGCAWYIRTARERVDSSYCRGAGIASACLRDQSLDKIQGASEHGPSPDGVGRGSSGRCELVEGLTLDWIRVRDRASIPRFSELDRLVRSGRRGTHSGRAERTAAGPRRPAGRRDRCAATECRPSGSSPAPRSCTGPRRRRR